MRRDAGLTLLELLLVVFILSVVALGAITLVDASDDQFRYEATVERLAAARVAILGELRGRTLLSGYVTDLGALPPDLAALVARPAGAPAFGMVAPLFSPGADTEVAESERGDAGIVALDAPRACLARGHRGSYLAATDGGAWRDGWGNVDPVAADDAADFGWSVAVDAAAGTFALASLGANGAAAAAAGPETGYDADLPMRPIGPGDWRVDLNVLQVLGTMPAGAGGTTFRAAVIALEDGTWVRHDSADTAAAGAAAVFSFAAGATVPLGRHLVVLLSDASGTWDLHDGDAAAGTQPVTAQVTLTPAMGSVEVDLGEVGG